MAGSPNLSGRIEFVILRTGCSPSVALHPVSRRRSYGRLQICNVSLEWTCTTLALYARRRTIPVFSRAWTRFKGSTVWARKRPESRFIRPREVIKDAGHKSGRSPWAPPSGCRSFSRYTSIGSNKSHRSRKNRHDGTSKDIVNSKKGRYVHKQRKTMERQSLTNSHRQSRWINIDLMPGFSRRTFPGAP